MTQAISYGSITISDLTDISDVYLQYALAESGANVDKDYPFNKTGERGWLVTYPDWQPGYQVWIRRVTRKTGLPTDFGTPYLDTAVNQTNTNINILQNKVRKFWENLTNHTNGAGGWIKPDYPAGIYMANGRENENPPVNFDYENSSTYGYNTYYGNGIKFRYNAFDLAELNGNGLKFYYSSVENETPTAQGSLAMELNLQGLNFYNPVTRNIDASLNSNGLYIDKGTVNLNDSVLYTLDKRTWDADSAGIYIGSDINETGFFTIMAGGRIQYIPTEDTEPYDTTEYFKITKILTDDLVIDGSKTYYKEINEEFIPIEQNEYYILTNDITINQDKKYYKLITGTTVEYNLVTDQDKEIYRDPHSAGWFELASPKIEEWYENAYQKVIPEPTDNPAYNEWFESAGPMWYMKSDGSASFSSLTIDRNGILEVPAASISGKLRADQIEVDNLSSISAVIGATVGQEDTTSTLKIDTTQENIFTADDRIVPNKIYYKAVGDDYTIETSESFMILTEDEIIEDELKEYYTHTKEDIPFSNANITTNINKETDLNDTINGITNENGSITFNLEQFHDIWGFDYGDYGILIVNDKLWDETIPLNFMSTLWDNIDTNEGQEGGHIQSELFLIDGITYYLIASWPEKISGESWIGSLQIIQQFESEKYNTVTDKYFYELSEDTEVNTDKTYYIIQDNTYVPIDNPQDVSPYDSFYYERFSKNPKEEGWYESVVSPAKALLYEKVNKSSIELATTKINYKLSNDIEKAIGKNYYKFKIDYKPSLDDEIKENKDYYEYDISEDKYTLINFSDEVLDYSPVEKNWYEIVAKYDITDEQEIINPKEEYLYERKDTYTSKIILEEGEISILSNEQEVVSVDAKTNDGFNIYNGTINNRLKIGNLELIPYDGGLAIRGGTEN